MWIFLSYSFFCWLSPNSFSIRWSLLSLALTIFSFFFMALNNVYVSSRLCVERNRYLIDLVDWVDASLFGFCLDFGFMCVCVWGSGSTVYEPNLLCFLSSVPMVWVSASLPAFVRTDVCLRCIYLFCLAFILVSRVDRRWVLILSDSFKDVSFNCLKFCMTSLLLISRSFILFFSITKLAYFLCCTSLCLRANSFTFLSNLCSKSSSISEIRCFEFSSFMADVCILLAIS